MTPSINPDRLAAIAAAVPAPVIAHGPRSPRVSCSQCGQSFGPGESGYSHCWEHSGTPEQRATLVALELQLRQAEREAEEYAYSSGYSLMGNEARHAAGLLRKRVADLRAAMVGSAA